MSDLSSCAMCYNMKVRQGFMDLSEGMMTALQKMSALEELDI